MRAALLSRTMMMILFRRRLAVAAGAGGRQIREWPLVDFRAPPKPRPAQPLDRIPTDGDGDGSLREPDYFRVADMFTVQQMMRAKVHYGHKTGALNEKMAGYLLGQRLGVCVFDLEQTAFHLRQALNFLAHMAYRDGVIVFFGGDSWSIHSIESTAREIGQYSHCRRYKPGTLLNSSIMFGCMIRHPDVGVFCSTTDSVFKQHKAVSELVQLCVPVIGVVDSNCDPDLITYPIPGNDDSPSALAFYLQMFKEAIRRGRAKAKEDFGGGPAEEPKMVAAAGATIGDEMAPPVGTILKKEGNNNK